MKFAAIRFHKSLDVSGLHQSSRFLLTAQEGFELELEPTHGTGVIATHPNRPLPLWIPATDIASGDVLCAPGKGREAVAVELDGPRPSQSRQNQPLPAV